MSGAKLGDIEAARAEQRRNLWRTDRDNALYCLAGIDPARLTRDEWLRVGMALKASGATAADWESWSRADAARFHEGECGKVWAGLNGSGVGLGSLVKMYRDGGGVYPPAGDAPRKSAPPTSPVVSFYSGKTDRVGSTMTLGAVLDGIGSGKWAALVEPVRAAVEAGDNAAKDTAKGRLPGFTAGGCFSARRKDGLAVHSGLVVTDLDHLPSPEDAARVRDALAHDAHVVAAFVSPSGLGVKALVRVEPCADAAEHEAAFAALLEHFAQEHGINLDTSGKDVSRLCFVSHDPGAFVREGVARPFAWRTDGATPDPLAGRKSLAELAEAPIDPEQTLLGNRFLCRRGAMLYVGRSGLGKSSSSGQQDACWALGREAFGILPAKPLNILCIQAENDDGDLHEMAAGVFLGLGLTEAETAEVHQRTTVVQWFESGEAFLTKLRDALAAEREAGRPFDLVRIDPLLSFAGGDLVNPAVIASFCRAGLNSIAYDFNCGIIAVHHTPKLNLTARPRMDGPEWIYAATGCADLANWARAILVIADGPNAMPGTFRLIGAKRGKRITWRDTDGEMEYERYFSHAENRGGMFWRPATPEETEVATARAAKDKKPTALQEIAGKDAATMESHALNILRKGPLTAADFRAGIMREFRINENYAKTVAKWLSEGDGKPVRVKILGKVHWHGTADQLAALQNPPLKGVKA